MLLLANNKNIYRKQGQMKASQVQILTCMYCQNPADEICPPTPYVLKITPRPPNVYPCTPLPDLSEGWTADYKINGCLPSSILSPDELGKHYSFEKLIYFIVQIKRGSSCQNIFCNRNSFQDEIIVCIYLNQSSTLVGKFDSVLNTMTGLLSS